MSDPADTLFAAIEDARAWCPQVVRITVSPRMVNRIDLVPAVWDAARALGIEMHANAMMPDDLVAFHLSDGSLHVVALKPV